MLLAVVIPPCYYCSQHCELCCPKCVNFGINEGHAVLKIPSWVHFCPCLLRSLYKLMLDCSHRQGTIPESEISRLWYCAPSLAQSRQSVDVSLNNELVNKWVMSEWINEWVKYLSPKEWKLNTALAKEAADWSQVHKPLGHFKNLNSVERTQCRSYRHLPLGGWNGSCKYGVKIQKRLQCGLTA